MILKHVIVVLAAISAILSFKWEVNPPGSCLCMAPKSQHAGPSHPAHFDKTASPSVEYFPESYWYFTCSTTQH